MARPRSGFFSRGARVAALAGILGAAPAPVEADPAHERVCQAEGASCAALTFEGLSYPYPREAGSYLFIDGGVYPYIDATDDLLGSSTVALPGGTPITAGRLLERLGLERPGGERLVPVAGYGSNPAPTQIARKFRREIASGGFVMPVMKGRLEGYDVVWTPLFVSYGGMPSTLFPSPGTTVDIWINWMRPEDVQRMDRTEGVGDHWYRRTRLQDAIYSFDGPQPASLDVYVSCYGALAISGRPASLESVPATGRSFEERDSVSALRSVLRDVGAGDVVDLVHANVVDPAVREANTKRLAARQLFAEGSFARGTCEPAR